jgi:hypothetical protein
MEIAIFWQKAVSWRKIKEKRPHLKFNFTTRASSIYLSHKCFLLLFAVAALHDKLYWRQYPRQFNKLF